MLKIANLSVITGEGKETGALGDKVGRPSHSFIRIGITMGFKEQSGKTGAWFRSRYYEKYNVEAPADLFVSSSHTPEGIQIKMDYYSLFDKSDYKQFRADMEALYREESGLPTKNEGWVNQAFLARCLEKVLTGIEVVLEASPPWLYGQRLDIFVPSLKLAVEYQGEQHYFPLEHLGGEQGLKDRQEMDERKRIACKKAGITLIEWQYNDNISVEKVRERIMDTGIEIGM